MCNHLKRTTMLYSGATGARDRPTSTENPHTPSDIMSTFKAAPIETY